jgi:predicted DNA-binding protein
MKRPYAARFLPGRLGTISSRVDPEAKARLEWLASTRGMSKSEYICRLLNDHIAAVTQRRSRA